MSTNIFKKAQAQNEQENQAALEAMELPQEPEGAVILEDDQPVDAVADETSREPTADERAERVVDRASERAVREENAAEREQRISGREADRAAKALQRAEASAKRLAEEAAVAAKLETNDFHERAARLDIRATALEADHALALELAHEAALKAARSAEYPDQLAAEQARAAEIDAYYAAREMKALSQNADREARARDNDVAEKAGSPVDRAAVEAANAEEIARQMMERNAHEAEVAMSRKATSKAVAAIMAGVDEPSVDDDAPAQDKDAPSGQSAAAKLAALKAEIEQRRAQTPVAPIAQPAVAGLDAEARAEALEEAVSEVEHDVDRIMSAAELGRARQAAAIARTEADLEEQAEQQATQATKRVAEAQAAAAFEAEAKAREEEARQEVSRIVNEVSVRARSDNQGMPTEEQLETWVAEAAAKLRESTPGMEEEGEAERAPLEMTPEARRVLLAYLQSRTAAGQLRETLQQIDAEGGGYGQQQSVEEQLAPVVEDMRKLFQDLVPALVDGDADKLQGLEDRIEAFTHALREENAIKRRDFGLDDVARNPAEVDQAVPPAPPSAAALDLVRAMVAQSEADGRLPSARGHEERLLEAGVEIKDDEPSLDENDGTKPRSIRPQAAWLLREYMRVRLETVAMIEALDAAGKAQPNMADELARARDAIVRRRDALGVDMARAIDHPDDQLSSSVQTSLTRFEAGAAAMIDQLSRGMTPEAVAAAASKTPVPATPQGLDGAGSFQGTDADNLDDEIGLGGKGMIANGDPEPAEPSRLAPSKAGDAFSKTPGDVVPPRPHAWPVVMAWPPHQYMQALAAPDVTPEQRAEFWKRLEEKCDPMMERAAQIDEWIRSQRGKWNLRDRNYDDRFARTHSIGDPYRGVRWALLLENKPIKAEGVNLWGHSRAYLADGGVVAARHDGVSVRKVSDQAVKLAMQESLARGYGSLKISGTKEFCMKAAELARAAGVEAEISYHGILGIKRRVKVMPQVPNPIVTHAGTENEAKTPGTPEFEGRQEARQLNEQAAEREAANRLPEPRPEASTRRRDPNADPRSERDDDLLDDRDRREVERRKTYADVDDGPNPFER